MGNLFKKRQKANKLLDEDYDNENTNFSFYCSPCITTNFKKVPYFSTFLSYFLLQNKWKNHFNEQCDLLRKYNVFWAYLLPSLLNKFSSKISQECFQSELSSPKNIQWIGNINK